jgi:uncharacterized circularly permuted ATP-grasp superfamily protein/uncharacterized alpha-E superfamily protein
VVAPLPGAGLPPLLADYRPLPGVSDELLDPQGAVRPVWRPLIEHLADLGMERAAARFARGDRYLRDAGVYFRQYAQEDPARSAERAWPLAHVPVLIEEDEWQHIAAGLVQRADLLEALAADLYGPLRLVSDGHLPASLVAENPEWLRPLVGHRPRSGHFLHFVAFEIGRGPDGTWWVLGDRTQAPSGAGFALENRVATARIFAEHFATANVHRLAGFFRAFRDALHAIRAETDSRAAILTPGTLNETYFEHAYIARYLGMSLLEGEDLVVENGRLMVRTVTGTAPVSVLWRRLDAAFADPLELDGASRIGTPGLVQAVRQGTVTVVNALGTGILETRAFLAFLPRLARTLLGENLILPNIATWWCGQAAERAHVQANTGPMMIGPALSTRLPFDMHETTVLGHDLRPEARAGLAQWLEAEGATLVAQEAVTLSTTPAHIDGRLHPRPMSLRVFLARTPQGWTAMPGGFARIGRTTDPAALAMQRGGSAADVWVVGPGPVPPHTMLEPSSGPFPRARLGFLPARAADNLFWLGRYVERAEGTMRLLRAWHGRLAESADREAPLLAYFGPTFEAAGVDPEADRIAAVRRTIDRARAAAGAVRDRFSHDGWMALGNIATTAEQMSDATAPGDDTARALSVLLRKITGFSGLVNENMYRSTGWRFLEIGRCLERAAATADLLATLTSAEAPDGALDLALEVGDSVMTNRRRYAVATRRETVLDLLALDQRNPRSVIFSMNVLQEQIDLLPGAVVSGQLSPLARMALKARTDLALATAEDLEPPVLRAMARTLASISDRLTDTYMR